MKNVVGLDNNRDFLDKFIVLVVFLEVGVMVSIFWFGVSRVYY